MSPYNKLLETNRQWAEKQVQDDPEFFSRLLNQQSPKFLWIGCSDSRVPADKITGTEPGEIFVHRNIANLVVNTDINLLSVLQYSVEVLKVEHVIVCGHYGCGGVKAAMGNNQLGIIDNWLKEIKDVYRKHRDEVNAITDPTLKADRMVELVVKEQVFNLAKTSIIQQAWKKDQKPQLHGWVYGLNNGILQPIVEMSHDSEMDSIYRFDNLA
jgi:carbonic anhydrase